MLHEFLEGVWVACVVVAFGMLCHAAAAWSGGSLFIGLGVSAFGRAAAALSDAI